MTRFADVVAAVARLVLVAAFGVSFLASSLPVSAQSAADQWKRDLPAPTGFVNDFAGVIDASSKARMETMARNFRDRTDIDIAVVTLQSLNERPIEDVALTLGRQWGIGAGTEKNGLIILLALGERQSRIEVSRKLEDEITDSTAGEILRQSRPQFARGEYGDGLRLALETVLATLAEKRGLSIEGIDAARAYGKQPAFGSTGEASWKSRIVTLIILVIVFVVIINVLKRMGGGGGRGGRGGRRRQNDSSWVWPIIVGMSSGGGGSSGGSSGGWSGGGGGSDWGGFGGGGDFGGGGASDSW